LVLKWRGRFGVVLEKCSERGLLGLHAAFPNGAACGVEVWGLRSQSGS